MKYAGVVAILVLIATPLPAHVGHVQTNTGTVTMMHGQNEFMIKTADGNVITIKTARSTRYLGSDNHAASRSELVVGTRVVVRMNSDGRTATSIKFTSKVSPSAASVVASLTTRGLHLTPGGTLRQPFFTVPATIYSVDGDDLQIYEYASSDDALRDARKISHSGTSVGTSKVSWLGPPHIYRKNNVMVIYLGDRASVREALVAELGAQFAGAP